MVKRIKSVAALCRCPRWNVVILLSKKDSSGGSEVVLNTLRNIKSLEVEQIEMQFSFQVNVVLKFYIGNVAFLSFSAGEAKWKSKILASCSRPLLVKLFYRNEAFRGM